MQFRITCLVAAAMLAAGAPVASFAQGAPIVPPPAPLGANRAPVAVQAPAASPAPAVAPTAAPVAAAPTSAPGVIPPEQAPSLNPAAVASKPVSPATLLDVAIPSAPKPSAVASAPSDLKPVAPGAGAAKPQTAKAASKKSKDADSAESKKAQLPADPFAGIVGTPVSDSQLNRFIFPEPIEGIYFQEGAPLPVCDEKAGEHDPCKPVFLNGKRMMLLQLRAGAKGPVQMLTHLQSGRVVTHNLMPTAGPGAIVRVDGAEDGASDTRLAAGRSSAGVGNTKDAQGLTASEQYVELLARIARGDIPAGFEAMPVDPGVTRFSLFDVTQQATWDNGAGLKAHLFKIKAHGEQPVAISAELFRHSAVQALALDRETITASEPAYLFMLEMVAEAQ